MLCGHLVKTYINLLVQSNLPHVDLHINPHTQTRRTLRNQPRTIEILSRTPLGTSTQCKELKLSSDAASYSFLFMGKDGDERKCEWG